MRKDDLYNKYKNRIKKNTQTKKQENITKMKQEQQH